LYGHPDVPDPSSVVAIGGDTVIAWILLGTYLIGWVASIPTIARGYVDDTDEELSNWEYGFGIYMGVVLGAIWFLALPSIYLWPYIVKVVYNK
jgi:hypothetical protein